jgi:hypothetical protein
MINNYEPLSTAGDTPLPASLKDRTRLHDGGFFIGADPVSPQVGNLRVKFHVARSTEISVVAWAVYRPILSIALIAVALCLAAAFKGKLKAARTV